MRVQFIARLLLRGGVKYLHHFDGTWHSKSTVRNQSAMLFKGTTIWFWGGGGGLALFRNKYSDPENAGNK